METETKKVKKEKIIYSPLKMTEALKEMGESYTKKEGALYYSVLLLVAVILGLLFELKPLYLIIVGAVYLIFVPQLIYNQKKQVFELRRFNDVNAYMSQMAQSFTDSQNILSALNETLHTFSAGKMHDVLNKALEIMDNEVDASLGKQKSLAYIEENYGCEKLKVLHDFLLMADERGGECEVEFSILEKTRMAWEEAVSKYRRELVNTRNGATVLYGMMLVLCIFIMNAFPETLSIIELEFIQIVNAVMLSLFVVFFVFMDIRINGSLLKDPKVMSKEMADSYFASMQGTTSEKERKKYIVYPIITAVAALLIFMMNPTPIIAALGIILVVVMGNMQRIILAITVSTLKNEIMKAFPKWLFDVMLLMQRESVDSAIIHSVKKAPPVLQAELNRISNCLLRNPGDADAYMSFLADFNILQIETTMRKLYSLSVGTGGKGDVMKFIIENNMNLLTDAEKRSIEMKGDVSSLYQFWPMIITTIGMIVYCVAIIFVSLSEIWILFE